MGSSWFLHVLVELLPAALVLQAGLGQVDGEHTGDSHHTSSPSIDQFGWQAIEVQPKKKREPQERCGTVSIGKKTC